MAWKRPAGWPRLWLAVVRGGNHAGRNRVQVCMDDEYEVLRAEGHDPDDPAVRAALDLVRWELELLGDS